MSKMNRRIGCIAACLIASLWLGGCSESSQTPGSDLLKSKENRTLTMYSEDLKVEYDSFLSPVAKEISKRTGIKLDISYPVEGVADKIDLMISSGEYPDLIMIKDTNRLVDEGAYLDLAPLIEAHAPNLKALYGKYMNRLKFSKADPSIYVLPSRPVGEGKERPEMGFQLQHEVVKVLGYPKIETVKDFENAIKAYKEKYPEINGEPTIGISFVNEDWRWKISLGNGAGFATGAPDDGNWFIDPKTHEATYRFLRPQEKEYYRWLNHMYHEGLIDPDSFVQNFEAYTAKIASGRVLGLIDAKWQYAYGENLLLGNFATERMYGQYPVQLDHTTTAADFRDIGYIAGYGIGISKDCKDPVTAIKFLDFMASEEGQILRNWGIEGVHYYYDDQGVRRFLSDQIEQQKTDPDYDMKTGINVYLYPFPSWGVGVKDSTGNPFSSENLEFMIQNYSEIEKEVLDAYKIKSWSDLYPSKEELPASLWGQAWDIPIPSDSAVRAPLEACDNIMRTGLVKLIVMPPEAFDDQWADMMRQLDEAGVHEMGKAFTLLIKERIEFWTK